jgi:hypothetical protein
MPTLERIREIFREPQPSPNWKLLRPADAAEIVQIVEGRICWRPNQMINGLELNTTELEYLLDQVGIEGKLEISRLQQDDETSTAIGSISPQGEATAVSVKTKVAPREKSRFDPKNQRHTIEINFDTLLRQASDKAQSGHQQRELLASLVNDSLMRGLFGLILKDLKTTSKQEISSCLKTLAVAGIFVGCINSFANIIDLAQTGGEREGFDHTELFVVLLMFYFPLRLLIGSTKDLYDDLMKEESKPLTPEERSRKFNEEQQREYHKFKRLADLLGITLRQSHTEKISFSERVLDVLYILNMLAGFVSKVTLVPVLQTYIGKTAPITQVATHKRQVIRAFHGDPLARLRAEQVNELEPQAASSPDL